MHYCGCKGTTKLQPLQRVFLRMLTHKAQQETIVNQPQARHYEQSKEEAVLKQHEHKEPSIGIPSLGLFDTNNPVYDPAEEEFRRQMLKKKKKRGPKL